MNDLRRFLRLVDRLETLHVVGGAERRGDERLRLAAREQRRAVSARQHARVDRDRADFVRLAAVDAEAGVEHLRAKRVVLDVADQVAQMSLPLSGNSTSSCSATSFFTFSTASMRVCFSFWLIASLIVLRRAP